MSRHELTFTCRVRGFAIDPRLSLGILVLGSLAALVLSAYIPDLLAQLTGPSRSIAIRGPGWVLLGILVVPLLRRLAEHRHAVVLDRDELVIHWRGSAPRPQVRRIPYAAIQEVALHHGQIFLEVGPGGPVALRPPRVVAEDMLDLIEERAAAARDG